MLVLPSERVLELCSSYLSKKKDEIILVSDRMNRFEIGDGVALKAK